MLTGLGMSLTMPAATTAVIEAAPTERAGLAGGTINASGQTGGLRSLRTTPGHEPAALRIAPTTSSTRSNPSPS
jgi:hypothetical protein